MIVARRFIAGFGTTWGLRPGGTPKYRRGIALGESEPWPFAPQKGPRKHRPLRPISEFAANTVQLSGLASLSSR
jgi:hypothetical protein